MEIYSQVSAAQQREAVGVFQGALAESHSESHLGPDWGGQDWARAAETSQFERESGSGGTPLIAWLLTDQGLGGRHWSQVNTSGHFESCDARSGSRQRWRGPPKCSIGLVRFGDHGRHRLEPDDPADWTHTRMSSPPKGEFHEVSVPHPTRYGSILGSGSGSLWRRRTLNGS
jgi:hypothetical protein